MLLIIEIILAIVAWKRGWKAWALVPLLFAFMAGIFFGLMGASPEQSYVYVISDLIAIAMLIIMCIIKREERTG